MQKYLREENRLEVDFLKGESFLVKKLREEAALRVDFAKGQGFFFAKCLGFGRNVATLPAHLLVQESVLRD